MKISNIGYIVKGILLTLSGALVAFFPGVISAIFYIIGGIIVISCIFSILGSSGDGMMVSTGITGIIIGILVMFLPKIISVSIPIIAGITFGIMGIIRIIRFSGMEKSTDMRTSNIVCGAVLAALGLFLLFNPFSAAKIARITVGIAMMLYGAFNFYVAHAISQRNKNTVSNIIDIDSFTITDDNKYLK